MPLPRFEKMPEDKKEQILVAAAKEFAASGYDKASMNKILERAGISKGTAYYYFEDKEDIIATVIRYYWLDFMDDPISEITGATAHDFWKKLEKLYLHPFEDIEEHPWMIGLSRAVWELPAEMRLSGHLGEVFGEAMVWLKDLVIMGIELGVMRDDMPVELLMELITTLDSVHDRWLATHWTDMDRHEREKFTRKFVDVLRNACRPASNGPRDGIKKRSES